MGERTLVLDQGARNARRERITLDDITSLEVTLSLTGCRLEVATGDGEEVRRLVVRFAYPEAGPFLSVVAAVRHLLSLPPEEGHHAGEPSGSAIGVAS